jgi:hypothetical protein
MRKNKSLLIVSFLISLITILVYLPALQNDFVNWDDNEYLYENPYIQSFNLTSIKWMLTSFHAANWHPLTWLSHTIDYAIWGLNPMGHHLTSIIFHGLNTFLVVILIGNLINLARNNNKQNTSLIVGAVTGVLFGLHPIHVESVVWASERKDVLCAFFFLLSILAYLRYTSALKRKAGLYVSCLVFFMLSLMSKPMAVTLPIVLLILDVYPLRRMKLRNITDSWRVIGEKVPFFVLSGISVVLTGILSPGRPSSGWCTCPWFLPLQNGVAFRPCPFLPLSLKDILLPSRVFSLFSNDYGYHHTLHSHMGKTESLGSRMGILCDYLVAGFRHYPSGRTGSS